MSKQLRLDVAQLTDVGRRRPHNEDNMAYVIPMDQQVMTKKGALFIVADGMGGHAAGEVASEIAVETVSISYYQDDTEDVSLSLMNAIKRANALIHQRAAENMSRSGMGTTCVAAVLRGNMAYIANVGDSRAYIIRHGQVRQISQDHSWVEEQVRAGLLTREQARSHAQRNVITRCLGTQNEVEVDVFPEQLEEGDTLILCSDGLSGSIVEDDLRKIIDEYVPQESVYHLVERANENGGPDNITAIVVRVQEVGQEQPNGRYPVRVGSREENEDTAVVGQVSMSQPTQPVQNEPARVASAPLRPLSGPLIPPGYSGPTHSEPEVAVPEPRRKRSRLLYPTLALLVLLVVALSGGAAYYFLRLTPDVNNKLAHASTLINQVDPNTATPTAALQQLSQAQQELLSLQGNLLVGDQAKQFHDLQAAFTDKTKRAIDKYNDHASIVPLSSTISTFSPAADNANVLPGTLVTLHDTKNTVRSYVLANDHLLYTLDDQHHLMQNNTFPTNIQLATSTTSRIFTLSMAPGQTNGFTLTMFTWDQGNNLKGDSVAPDTAALNGGWTPRFLMASGNDVYVILTQTTSKQLKIFDYATDNWHNQPQSFTSTIDPDLVSAVALSNKELIFLTKDGHVKSLFLNTGNGNLLPSASDIPVQNPILLPLNVDSQNFTWNTALAVTPQPSGPSGFLNLPGATLLAASVNEGTTSLFIVDNVNHRIVQLKLSSGSSTTNPNPTATASPTATATASATATATVTPSPTTGSGQLSSWQFVRQYTSSKLFSSVKSIVLDPASTQLFVLSQTGKSPATMASFDTAMTPRSTP